VVAVLGPGGWSVDGHVAALQDLWGWPGLGIALGGGGGGAALLLLGFWRPKTPEASPEPGQTGG